MQAWCCAVLWQALMGDPFAQLCRACMLTTEPAAHKHLRMYLHATMLMWGDGHAGGRSRRGSVCGGRGRSSGAPRAAQRRDGPAAEGAPAPQHAGCCGRPRVDVPSRHACRTSWAAACAGARRRTAHLVAHAAAPMRPLRANPRAALAGLTPGPVGPAWHTLPYPNPMTTARGRGAGAGGAVRAQGRGVGAARRAAALPALPGREGSRGRMRVRGRQADRLAGRLPRRGAGSGPRGLGLGRRTACMGARRRTLQGPRVVLAVCGAAQHGPRRGGRASAAESPAPRTQDARKSAEVQDRSLDSKTYTAALAAVAAQRAAAAAVRVRCGECEACLDAARVRAHAPAPVPQGAMCKRGGNARRLMPPCIYCHANTCMQI